MPGIVVGGKLETRRVRWLGDFCPFVDPVISKKMFDGDIHPKDVELLRIVDQGRQTRYVGVTAYHLVPTETEPFSRYYVFGPHDFDVEMTIDDLKLLWSLHPLNVYRFQVVKPGGKIAYYRPWLE